MSALTREEIFAARDLPAEFVKTPEWSATGDPEAGIWIAAFDGLTRAAFLTHVRKQAEVEDKAADVSLAKERLIVYAAVKSDEDRARLFTEEDIPALARRNALVLERLVRVAQRLNGIGAREEGDIAKK